MAEDRFFVADGVTVRDVAETRNGVRVRVHDPRDGRVHRIRFHERDALRRAHDLHCLRAFAADRTPLMYVRNGRTGALIDVANDLAELLARS